MSVDEMILRVLSRPPGDADYASAVQEWTCIPLLREFFINGVLASKPEA